MALEEVHDHLGKDIAKSMAQLTVYRQLPSKQS